MTLAQLEHVLAAHRAGSFSRAARAVGITQAALSNSIAKLEDELGDRVFARTTRRVALTTFGLGLLPHIEHALGGRDAILASARARQTPTSVVVGHSPLIPTALLTRVIGTLRAASGDAGIRLIEENLADLLQRLVEHTIDLAIVPESTYARALRSVPIFEEPLYFVPRRSWVGPAGPVELKDVAHDPFVMVPDRCGLARTTRGLFAEADLPLVTYGGEAMGYHVLQEWAALDLGSAILPASRLSEPARAQPLMRTPTVAAALIYRAVWHGESRPGKHLAARLRVTQPSAARAAAVVPRAGSARRGP